MRNCLSLPSSGSCGGSSVTALLPHTLNSSSHYRRLLLLVICLAITFCLLIYYTHPLHSALYAVAAVPHLRHQYSSVDPGNGSGPEVLSNASSHPFTFQAHHSQYGVQQYDSDDRPLRLRVQGTQRRLPKALIIGVRKCGTRALIEMLNLHPNIRKRDAEVHFFDDDDRYLNGLEWYRKKMPYSFDDQITVEKTPSYFVSREAPARIHAMSADTKLLLIVRDPALRVLSDYAQIRENKLAKGSTFKSFTNLVFQPDGQVNDRYGAVQISQYVVHVLRWLRVFSRDQLHIVDGDMLIRNPYPEIRKVEKFLQLPAKISPNNFYYNRTKGFYCMRNETHQKCLAESKGRRHPYVDPTVMEQLRRYFAPFNDQFYQIIGQNFSWPTS